MIFSFFVAVSVGIICYFLFEDFSISLQETLQKKSVPELNGNMFNIGFIVNLFNNPLNLIVIGIWIICCILFTITFKPRLKPMFQFFLWVSVIIIFIFFFWSLLINYVLSSENQTFYNIAVNFHYSPLSKTILLIVWGFFSIYMSFTYVNTKYLSIFGRLDYLFSSILRGNWDAYMFFRDEDHFAFLATSFNNMKQGYLKTLYNSDDVLIQIKDKLSSNDFSQELKQDILNDIKSLSSTKN